MVGKSLKLNLFSRQKKVRPKLQFGGEIIHAELDEFGLIQVIDSPICRSLHFNTAVKQSRYFFQSPLSLAFEYQQVLEQRILQHYYQTPTQHLLMLGTGGGSLASKLYISLPKLHMTLVDLRASVIDIAYDFFHLPQHPNIQTLSQDAQDFINHKSQSYDVIVVDLFNAKGMPQVFSQPAFLSPLLECCRPNGAIFFNLWQSTPAPTLSVIKFFEPLGNFQLHPIKSSKNLVLQFQKT